MILITKGIDARGLACPQPVILVDRTIADGISDLEILVNNEVARDNVTSLAKKRGLKTDARHEDADIIVDTTKT